MTRIDKQIELLEARISYLKTLDKMLERDASFKEVAAFVTSEENEDVAEKKAFLQELVRLLRLEDDFGLQLNDEDDDFDE
jgi:hypothetical protein